MADSPTMLWLQTFTLTWIFTRGYLTQVQNAALHKQATQSSVFTDGYGVPHTADMAVDGKNDPNFYSGPCACTGSDDVTWWQVDLGDLFDIIQVKVTNRLSHGLRLHDFDIKVSNTSSMSPSDLCAHYAGTMPDGATETVPCDTAIAGRFLRISKISDPTIHSGDHLQLCEVEVLVMVRKYLKYFRHSGKKVVSSRPLLPVTHRVLCDADVLCVVYFL